MPRICVWGGPIKAKFVQNSTLIKLLESTGTKQLVDSCSDKLWGNGIPLYDNTCLDPKYWDKQGILDEILEDILHGSKPLKVQTQKTHCRMR